jgi:hypothetical protein
MSGIDNLRVGLSALVVAHHALQPYGFNQNWAVVEHVPPVPVLGLFLWIDACFFMGLFFLIAGLFTPGSVERKGVGPYVHDRGRRLGFPLLLGLFVLLPPLGWYAHVHNRHLGWVSYPDYFVRFWLGVGGRPVDWPAARFPDMNLGHLWFVEHLLVYAFLYGAWRSLRPKAGRATGSPPGDLTIGLYAVGLGIATWAMRLWWPMNAWTAVLGFFQVEPAHLPPVREPVRDRDRRRTARLVRAAARGDRASMAPNRARDDRRSDGSCRYRGRHRRRCARLVPA